MTGKWDKIKERQEKALSRFSCKEFNKEFREKYDEAISRLLFHENYGKNI